MHHRELDIDGLTLGSRRNASGHRYFVPKTIVRGGKRLIYASSMWNSDVHLGTRQSAAKNLCHMEQTTICDVRGLIGDVWDLWRYEEKDKYKFGPDDPRENWHHEYGAHILRKADQPSVSDPAKKCETAVNGGNHDDYRKKPHVAAKRQHRNLNGKEIYGIKIEDEYYFTDPVSGFVWWVKHGDDYDDAALGEQRDRLYAWGDWAEDVLVSADEKIGAIREQINAIRKFGRQGIKQALDEVDDWSQTLPDRSIAATLKRATKWTIYNRFGVREEIVRSLNNNIRADGLLFGHFHWLFIDDTCRKGKLRNRPLSPVDELLIEENAKIIMNDGCGTEHYPNAIWGNDGIYALIKWHAQEGFEIVGEFDSVNRTISREKRFFSGEDLGFSRTEHPEFYVDPQHFDDKYKDRFSRLLRSVYRMAPPQERARELTATRQRADAAKAAGDKLCPVSTAYLYPLREPDEARFRARLDALAPRPPDIRRMLKKETIPLAAD